MKGWTETTLSEVADIIPGYAFKGTDFGKCGVPVIKIKDICPPKVDFSNIEYVDIKKYKQKNIEKVRVFENDFVVAMTGATIGKIGKIYSSEEAYINQRVAKIRPKNFVDWNYIYYNINSSEFYQHIQNNIDSHSAQENISTTSIGRYSLQLPNLDEQRTIAAVLSSLDDKIDLLHRQNATLEAMAEALFRQWFVVEAKDEWEEKPLLHYVKLIGGGTPKTSVKGYWGGRIPWLSGGDIAGAHKSFVLNSEKTISEDGINNSSAKLLPKFATILTARGTVGKFCLLGTSMAYSQTNYGILPADDESYFFTFLLVDHLIKELQMAAYGSVFDTITTQTFEEVKLALPSVDDILKFEGQVTSFFSKMFANQTQIRTLEKLRDTLLPKLMSGEVRVDF